MITRQDIRHIIDTLKEIEESSSSVQDIWLDSSWFFYSFLYKLHYRDFVIDSIYQNEQSRPYLLALIENKTLKNQSTLEYYINHRFDATKAISDHDITEIKTKDMRSISVLFSYLIKKNIVDINAIFSKKLSKEEFEKYSKTETDYEEYLMTEYFKKPVLWHNDFHIFYQEKHKLIKDNIDQLSKKEVTKKLKRLRQMSHYKAFYDSYHAIRNFNLVKYLFAKYIFNLSWFFQDNWHLIKFVYLTHFVKNYQEYNYFHNLLYNRLNQNKIDTILKILSITLLFIYGYFVFPLNIGILLFIISIILFISWNHIKIDYFRYKLPILRLVSVGIIFSSIIYALYQLWLSLSDDSLFFISANMFYNIF